MHGFVIKFGLPSLKKTLPQEERSYGLSVLFRLILDSISSSGRITDEQWIWQDVEGSNLSSRDICLAGLKKITTNLNDIPVRHSKRAPHKRKNVTATLNRQPLSFKCFYLHMDLLFYSSSSFILLALYLYILSNDYSDFYETTCFLHQLKIWKTRNLMGPLKRIN
jgi:hypothetical protein